MNFILPTYISLHFYPKTKMHSSFFPSTLGLICVVREDFPEDEGGWRTSNKKLLFQVFTGQKPILLKNIYIIYICNIPVYIY